MAITWRYLWGLIGNVLRMLWGDSRSLRSLICWCNDSPPSLRISIPGLPSLFPWLLPSSFLAISVLGQTILWTAWPSRSLSSNSLVLQPRSAPSLVLISHDLAHNQQLQMLRSINFKQISSLTTTSHLWTSFPQGILQRHWVYQSTDHPISLTSHLPPDPVYIPQTIIRITSLHIPLRCLLPLYFSGKRNTLVKSSLPHILCLCLKS